MKSEWESQKGGKHPKKGGKHPQKGGTNPKNLWNPAHPIPQSCDWELQLVSKFKTLHFKRVQTIPGHVEKLEMRGFLSHRNPWTGQRP